MGMQDRIATLEDSLAVFLINLPDDAAVLVLDTVYPREMKTYVRVETWHECL